MKFRTMYDKLDSELFTEHGNAEIPTFILNDDGILEETGCKNLYDEIQSHRESVELSVLLQRYAQGDESALNKVQGVYEDIVGAPSTYAELFDAVKNAETSFNGLPEGLRQLFDNSPVEFWKTYGTPEFAKKVREFDLSKSKKAVDTIDNNNNFNNNDPVGRDGSVINE